MACWGIGPAGGWALNETSAALRHDAADRPLGIGVPADRVRKRAAEDHSYFPDKLPIGVQKHDLDHHVFLYLVTRTLPIDFRMFLLRHAELFRTLHTWTVRVLVPRRFWKTTALYKTALRDELWTPLELHITDRLATYFRER